MPYLQVLKVTFYLDQLKYEDRDKDVSERKTPE